MILENRSSPLIFQKIRRQLEASFISLGMVYSTGLALDKMSIACPQWRDSGVPSGGNCSAGHFGGRPSLGTCSRCIHLPANNGKGIEPPPPGFVQKIAHGIAGLTKSACGINRASDEVIAQRRAICATCEFATVTLGVVQCAACGCALSAKQVNADEQCPKAKWPTLPVLLSRQTD